MQLSSKMVFKIFITTWAHSVDDALATLPYFAQNRVLSNYFAVPIG